MKIGIIGIGNPLRQDDGIGIVLLEKLRQEKKGFPDDLEYVDGGTGGMSLLHVLVRFDIAVVVDAVDFNGKPGEYIFFNPDESRSKKPMVTTSTHGSDFFDVLRVSKQLHENPDKLYIFGIQPKTMSAGTELSSELKYAIPTFILSLKREINRIYDEKG